MKLYIQQKVFSFQDQFAIKDVNGNPVYYGKGEFFSLGKRLHIYDSTGKEVCLIAQELFRFMPTYSIQISGFPQMTISKKVTFFVPHYQLSGMNWEIEGDFLAHDYQIQSAAGEVASLSKEWLSWGDAYELNVFNSADVLPALAIVLTIDAVMASN